MKTLSLFCTFIFFTIVSCEYKTPDHNEKASAKTQKADSINFQTGYSEVNGLKMYYEIHGTGKPLVLIHGGGSTIQTTFGRILNRLALNRQVIGVELQAHGHTSDRSSQLSFEQDADDVAQLMKNLNIVKADFFGFSNGGNTTMQIAIRHPEIVNKIIVASAFYKRSGMLPQFWDFMSHANIKDMPKELKEEYRKVAPDSSHLQVMHDKDVYRMVHFKDWSDDALKSIKAPCLILDGDADVVTPEHAVAMFRLIPNCKLAIIPGGHGKYIGEVSTLSKSSRDIELIIPLIEEFLDTPLENSNK